jgi:hypothetical protein
MSLSDHIAPAKNISHSVLFRRTLRRSALILALPALATALHAQNAAQSAGQSSSSTGGTTVTTVTAGQSKTVLATPTATDLAKSAHLTAHAGPPPEDVNRKALEESAGKDAGKLLVRSTPSHARIYVNGAFVGYAPQLFVVPPGKYKVELRGQRDNYAERTLGLLPNDTQEVSLDLTARYPFHVTGSH